MTGPEPGDLADPRLALVAQAIRASDQLGCGCCAAGVPCQACDDNTVHDCQTWDRAGYLAQLIVAALDKGSVDGD